jgi:hypothetical protein
VGLERCRRHRGRGDPRLFLHMLPMPDLNSDRRDRRDMGRPPAGETE